MLDKAEHLSNKPSTLTHACLMKTVVNLTHSPTPSFNIVRAKNIILGRIFVQIQQIVRFASLRREYLNQWNRPQTPQS